MTVDGKPVSFALIVLLSLMTARHSALASDRKSEAEAAAFVTHVFYDGMKILVDPTIDQAQRRREFRALVVRNVDVPRVARFVLGRSWARATEKERHQFTMAYTSYLSDVYVSHLGQFSGAILEVRGTRRIDDEIKVSTAVAYPGQQTSWALGWLVAQTAQGFKIEDIDVQGASLRVTERRSVTSLFERSGGTIVGLIRAILDLVGEAVP